MASHPMMYPKPRPSSDCANDKTKAIEWPQKMRWFLSKSLFKALAISGDMWLKRHKIPK
jgi:hypothetical protein